MIELGDSSYFLNSLALDMHDLSTINFIFLYFLYSLYYTTYNTAHAASRLWRYSSIYINPSQAA